MASIFLINDNKIVSRLLQLSSDKHGYLLEEKMEPEPSKEHYDIILVDSDKYTPNLIKELKDKTSFDKAGYIGMKKESVPDEFDISLDKPFLPSDFVAMIEANISISKSIPDTPQQDAESKKTSDDELSEDELEVDENVEKLLEEDDNIDETLEDELEELSEIDEIDELNLEEELSVEPKNIESDQTALKEIDKTEDALKELDELDEELENVDLSLDSSAVMTTGVAEQFLQDQESETSNEELQESDLTKDEELQELTSANEDTEDHNTEKPNTTIEAAATTAAAAAGAILMTEKEQILQEITPQEEVDQSSLDALEGIEDIEKESDYIAKEEETDEFASLDEAEIQKALNPHDEEKSEEIVKEDIVTEGSETVVETNDVQQWIQEAVAKAITPEMIKEALNDMKINITLDFTKKES